MDRKRQFSAFVASGGDPRPSIVGSLEFAREYLVSTNLDERLRVKAMVVIEELVSNCLRYGSVAADISMQFSLEQAGDTLIFELEDNGPPFDPTCDTKIAGPDPKTGGSVGLAIVRAWAADMRYARCGGSNALKVIIA